jgi:hypothetical protein
LRSVTTTVYGYVPALAGLAVATCEVVSVKPKVGVQAKLYKGVPPEMFTVKSTVPLVPSHHVVVPLALMLTAKVGGCTVTFIESTAVHPFESVTVTVYTVFDPIFLMKGLDNIGLMPPVTGDH